MFSFLFKRFEKGRRGILKTPHGIVETPAFIFCATKAAMKGLSPSQMKEAGTQIILSNTYHLMLQPGGDVLEKMGGLQNFTGWKGPMLTDSGGFQIFSLGYGSVAEEIKGKRYTNRPKTVLKISEDGATFKSYIDGRNWLLTPESSIQIQKQLGADLVVVLDECTPFHVEKSYTKTSMERSHRWALRSLREFEKSQTNQKLYGIIQGGVFEDLRKESCDFVNQNNFFGHAVGGSLGASKEQMYDVVRFTVPLLEEKRPIHLLGIGGIKDIWEGVEVGIDTFDCVHPTRLARHGGALIKKERHINIRNSRYRLDSEPLDVTCACSTCQNFSKSYLHHLFKANEILGMSLLSLHNVFFMNTMMKSIRDNLDCPKKWIEAKNSWCVN
jgi:queuine tRNA-ribosyltransferase